MSVRSKMNTLIHKKDKVIEQIKKLQGQCTHENFTGVYECDTGNWCPDDDTYWILMTCLDCDMTRYVSYETNEAEYRRLSMTGKIKSGS